MRYHIYTDARRTTGEVAAADTVAFYTDAGCTTLATLYSAISGGTTLDNPYTVPSSGIISVYVTQERLYVIPEGDDTGRLIYAANPATSTINVRDYGATGDGTTDDTAAFQAAIDACEAQYLDFGALGNKGHPVLYIPPGIYLVDGFEIDFTGFKCEGAGSYQTILKIATGGTGFRFGGPFDSTPAHNYVGSGYSQGWEVSGLTLSRAGTCSYTSIDTYTETGIRDNGAGTATLRDVRFYDLQYGFASPYGCDYQWVYGCDFNRCDVGIYYGPGCQQVNHFGTTFCVNHRDLVLEWSMHANFYGCTHNEFKDRAIDIKIPAISEFGIDITGIGLAWAQELCLTWHGLWMETGAGWGTSWAPEEFIRIGTEADHTAGRYLRNVRFHDTYVCAGTGTMGTPTNPAFLRCEGGSEVLIDHIEVEGNYIDHIVAHPVDHYPTVTVNDYDQIDGYDPIDTFEYGSGGMRETDSFTGNRQGAGATAPVTGVWGQGDVYWNTGAVHGGYAGWIYTDEGWQTFGVITS